VTKLDTLPLQVDVTRPITTTSTLLKVAIRQVFQFTLTCSYGPIFICFVSIASLSVALEPLIAVFVQATVQQKFSLERHPPSGFRSNTGARCVYLKKLCCCSRTESEKRLRRTDPCCPTRPQSAYANLPVFQTPVGDSFLRTTTSSRSSAPPTDHPASLPRVAPDCPFPYFSCWRSTSSIAVSSHQPKRNSFGPH